MTPPSARDNTPTDMASVPVFTNDSISDNDSFLFDQSRVSRPNAPSVSLTSPQMQKESLPKGKPQTRLELN